MEGRHPHSFFIGVNGNRVIQKANGSREGGQPARRILTDVLVCRVSNRPDTNRTSVRSKALPAKFVSALLTYRNNQ
jgi:hypothetical protein